jgi:N-acetylneuraminate synthase
MAPPTNNRVFVIAEAGVNHNGSLDIAMALVDAAAQAGADAVKFQTFDAKALTVPTAPKAAYQKAKTDPGQSQLEMLQTLELHREWHAPLRERALSKSLAFLSTPFDRESLRFLVELGMPLLKVPSGELTNAPLLWLFARSGLDLIVSTGMATLSEVEQALAVITHGYNYSTEPRSLDDVWECWSDSWRRRQLDGRVTLLHCTSEYPAPFADVNLRAMDTLASSFGLPVGYSDHTEGPLVSLAAVARGATVIEKHFTLDRNLRGPDHAASLEPAELASMIADIRKLELALGSAHKAPMKSELPTRAAARQNVVAARDIALGETITRNSLTTARAGQGLPAHRLWDLVGTASPHLYRRGEAIKP